jgi:hypothetical protein
MQRFLELGKLNAYLSQRRFLWKLLQAPALQLVPRKDV